MKKKGPLLRIHTSRNINLKQEKINNAEIMLEMQCKTNEWKRVLRLLWVNRPGLTVVVRAE